ncbi:Glucan endo-1,3-beta-glucosidase 4 [Hibiscus syriacus]|uniref:glucan endo-1,3-beta-D-glucosidase n=1 Tax=Hibiscus syriacus TaxID=106335 RepID=A0A6A2Z6X1_HIBSY|nr:Glucan endo-1,3-beta-glucosidase 4 [Hibiscus syriacus]
MVPQHLVRLQYGPRRNSNLSGHLVPEVVKLEHLQYLELYKNNIQGTIPAELGNLKSLISLDLYNNNSSGTIPRSLGKLKHLVCECSCPSVNHFMCHHDHSLSSYSHVTDCNARRLNDKKLTGPIPRELVGVSSLKVVDVSSNDLCGPIPTSGPFEHIPLNNFEKNPRLEGPELLGLASYDTNCSSSTVKLTVFSLPTVLASTFMSKELLFSTLDQVLQHDFFIWVNLVLNYYLEFASGAFVGVNIGTDVSSMPSALDVVAIFKAHQITHIRLYDADSHMLKELAGSGIEVTVGVTNEEVIGIGESGSAAAAWINKNVASYVPSTNITAIAVGSEVLTSIPHAAPVLVTAMNNLHKALVAADLNFQVKVSTPQSMDIIPKPFPPSTATFNSSWNSTVYQLLQFLKNTSSYYMLNAYPYYGYSNANGIFPIDYALFKPLPEVKQIVDPNTLFHYNSMRVSNNSDPPSQPTIPINTCIYELFNEDKRPGPVSEKNWGLLFTNGSAVFPLSLSGSSQINGNSTTVFCVAKDDASEDKLRDGLNWACGQGKGNCSAIQSGKPCYLPNNIKNHASYAYNDYYQKMHTVGGTCDFDGTATAATNDPNWWPGSLRNTDFSSSFDCLIGDPSVADQRVRQRSMVLSRSIWVLPPTGFFKLNVDGAVTGDWLKGGIGGIIKDSGGLLLVSFSEAVGQGPPTVAEMLAIKRGYGSCIFTGSSNSSTGGRTFPPAASGPISAGGSRKLPVSKVQFLISAACLVVVLL